MWLVAFKCVLMNQFNMNVSDYMLVLVIIRYKSSCSSF